MSSIGVGCDVKEISLVHIQFDSIDDIILYAETKVPFILFYFQGSALPAALAYSY